MHIVKWLKYIPPKEWNHDPLLVDKYGNTIGILLSS